MDLTKEWHRRLMEVYPDSGVDSISFLDFVTKKAESLTLQLAESQERLDKAVECTERKIAYYVKNETFTPKSYITDLKSILDSLKGDKPKVQDRSQNQVEDMEFGPE